MTISSMWIQNTIRKPVLNGSYMFMLHKCMCRTVHTRNTETTTANNTAKVMAAAMEAATQLGSGSGVEHHSIYGMTFRQHSPAWRAVRRVLITASIIPSLIPLAPPYTDSFNTEFPHFAIHNNSTVISSATNSSTPRSFAGSSLAASALDFAVSTSIASSSSTTDGNEFSHNETHASRWGNDFEPVAVRIFEEDAACNVETVGLIVHGTQRWLACSPDGLIGKDKALEIKCPVPIRASTDPRTALALRISNWAQAQAQLEVLDRDVCIVVRSIFSPYVGRAALRGDRIPRRAMGAQLFDYAAPYSVPLATAGAASGSFAAGPALFSRVTRGKLVGQTPPCRDARSVENELANLVAKSIMTTNNDGNGISRNSLYVRFWFLDSSAVYVIRRDKQWFDMVRPTLYAHWQRVAAHHVAAADTTTTTSTIP